MCIMFMVMENNEFVIVSSKIKHKAAKLKLWHMSDKKNLAQSGLYLRKSTYLIIELIA